MPLAGGDQAHAEVTVGRLAPLVRDTWRAPTRSGRYAELLEHPTLAEQPLRGYLNGSIDAVLRVPDPAGVPRYLVVDYKTNWLGSFDGRPLTVGDYAPPRLVEAMMAAHYPLQALLYGVAVHRLLRWRQPGYDPATHLGGVLYLFVRGMAGPDTPRVGDVPCGVFSWRPPAALVTDLSDLLDGRDPEESTVSTTTDPSATTRPVVPPQPSPGRPGAGPARRGAAGHVQRRRGAPAGGRAHRAGGGADGRGARGAGAARPGPDRPGAPQRLGLRGPRRRQQHRVRRVGGTGRPRRPPLARPDGWVTACRASPLVGVGAGGDGSRPLRWHDGQLYLERYWQQEELVRRQLQQRFAAEGYAVDAERGRAALQRLFPRVGSTRTRWTGSSRPPPSACSAG
jgi:hypothetical protein